MWGKYRVRTLGLELNDPSRRGGAQGDGYVPRGQDDLIVRRP
jgi:hypothetical protein